MTSTMAKEERIHIRATSEQKQLLARASQIRGRSVSDFVLESAVEEATNALLDQRVFVFSEEDYDAFLTRANDVEKNREVIAGILNVKSPWEG